MKNKILGIDYGDKRVGLALAEMGSIAVPLKVVQNSGPEALLEEIREIINSEEVKSIVIGLPHSFSGNTNERLETTQAFVDFLKGSLNDIGVSTVDEQLTSTLYENMGVKKDIDKHSATAILETYLTQNDR